MATRKGKGKGKGEVSSEEENDSDDGVEDEEDEDEEEEEKEEEEEEEEEEEAEEDGNDGDEQEKLESAEQAPGVKDVVGGSGSGKANKTKKAQKRVADEAAASAAAEEERRMQAEAAEMQADVAQAKLKAAEREEKERQKQAEKRAQEAQRVLEASWPHIVSRIDCAFFFKTVLGDAAELHMAPITTVAAVGGSRRRVRLEVCFPAELDIEPNVHSRAAKAWEHKFHHLHMDLKQDARQSASNWTACSKAAALALAEHYKCRVSWHTNCVAAAADERDAAAGAAAAAAASAPVFAGDPFDTSTLSAVRSGVTSYGARGLLFSLLAGERAVAVRAIWLQQRDCTTGGLTLLSCEGHYMHSLDSRTAWSTAYEGCLSGRRNAMQRFALTAPILVEARSCASVHALALGDVGLLGVSRDLPQAEESLMAACGLQADDDLYCAPGQSILGESISAGDDHLRILAVVMSAGPEALDAVQWGEQYSFVGMVEYEVEPESESESEDNGD